MSPARAVFVAPLASGRAVPPLHPFDNTPSLQPEAHLTLETTVVLIIGATARHAVAA